MSESNTDHSASLDAIEFASFYRSYGESLDIFDFRVMIKALQELVSATDSVNSLFWQSDWERCP